MSTRIAATARALAGLALLAALWPTAAEARYDGREPWRVPEGKGPQGVFALDGEFVHNVGELQLNITNWGLIGSRPSVNAPYSDAPSAMWPAGSGVDYLWAAGLWVGAIKNGVPLVSTGQFTPELLANGDDPLDTVYEMRQGETGGGRYPDPSEDDDGDGLINEDPKNGLDDDGDGLIDEDFAAISNQHFRCVMKDNTALAEELFPDHDPLDIEVVQESFSWENDSVDDFIGFEFTITNIGVNALQSVFLGFFADCDIGPRSGSGIADDDLPGFEQRRVRAKDGSIVEISVAFMYDADGDGGQAPGFFGMLFLNHDTDPSGERAPQRVEIRSYQNFSGGQPFDRGGDPTNDAERYDLLSRAERDNFPELFNEGRQNDFRYLVANGPFSGLEPGESLKFQAAFVLGEGLDGMVTNAAEAALTFYGAYFNKDVDDDTGVKGRETEICLLDFGPPGPANPIFTIFQDCVDSTDLLGDNPPSPIAPEDLDEDGCIYINNDCPFEESRGATNCTIDAPGIDPGLIAGCTGVQGDEFWVPWLVGLAPQPPGMRIWQTDNRVHVFWNSISQLIPDVRLQKVDFESYRIWRADGWDRPFGSSIENGPESTLWSLIAEYDEVNFFTLERELPDGTRVDQVLPLGPNTGLDVIRYQPQVTRPGHPVYEQFGELRALVETIVADSTLGPFKATDDPANVLRVVDEDGELTDVGAAYPQLGDWQDSYDQADSLFSDMVGLDYYEYVDRTVFNGIYYFYAVTATDFAAKPEGDVIKAIGPGLAGDPQSNFEFATPLNRAQTAAEREQFGHDIYVVPNPATQRSLSEFSQLNPNADDPTGVRIMFSNLPAARNTIRIYTLAGDLVATIEHDGRNGGGGSAFWNFVSRNGQEVVSGIYLYSVESEDDAFERVIGRFTYIN